MKQPCPVIATSGNEHVAFDGLAEHKTENQWRARPAELFHQPTQNTKEEQCVEIAPVARGLERADIHDYENDRNDQRVAQCRDLGEKTAKRKAQGCAEDIGNDNAPHHRVSDVEIALEHFRPGHQPMNKERAEQDRHRRASRHSKRDSRNQCPAFFRVVGRFRRDEATHVALTEGFVRVFFAAQRMGIGKPADHGSAKSRNRADRRSDAAATDGEEPMAADVPQTLDHALLDFELRYFGHRGSRDRQIA